MTTRKRQTTSGTTISACDRPPLCTQPPPAPRRSQKSNRRQKPTKTCAGESPCTWILLKSSTTPGSWLPPVSRWVKIKTKIIQLLTYYFRGQAFQCAGRCVYPISDHLTPTKHSVIQTLVHSLSSKRAQKACCVPTKLKPISLLYLDSDNVLTYRFSYEDMVVAECGCRWFKFKYIFFTCVQWYINCIHFMTLRVQYVI